jgi:hypothetical protein
MPKTREISHFQEAGLTKFSGFGSKLQHGEKVCVRLNAPIEIAELILLRKNNATCFIS